MARARNLKPGFFKNEDLAECSPWARLCFAGLWTLADREGRLEDRPKRIKGELFAFDSIEVEPLLTELEKYGFIHRYEAEDGRGLIQVTEFCKHQNPHHREPESALPPPKSLRLTPVANLPKPEAQQACDDTKAPGKPEASASSDGTRAQGQPRASPGHDPPRCDLARGSSRADSGYSDSGTLIPDTLIPEPPSLGETPRPPKRRSPAVAGAPAVAPTNAAWKSYAEAYRARYEVEPVRNATVNGQLAQLVARLGAEEAPGVAAFYLGHRNGLYVSAMHPVNLLLRDAEKLRTEWATGRQVTLTQGQLADKTQTNLNAFAPLIAEAKAREAQQEPDDAKRQAA